MNLMGKIFTFLIFLMSTVFLVVSIMVGASDRNWKAKAAELKIQASSASNKVDSLKDDSAKLKKALALEQAARATQLANLHSVDRESQAELQEKTNKFNEVQETAQIYARELEEANRRLVDQDAELKGLKANTKKLIDDIATQFAENRNIEKLLFELTAKLEQLTKKEADLAAELAQLQKVAKAMGFDKTTLTASIAPKIEAVVTAVGQNGDKFAIAVGRDDGLRKGHEMDIYRSNRHVGVGRIIVAENNRSVLSIVKGMMNGNVREGDNVSTKL